MEWLDREGRDSGWSDGGWITDLNNVTSILFMSDLLINWLNDEVQLSKRITNFEEDFHNGFLFGELLSKFSQQLNFNEFVNKDDKNSRIKNFTLLYDTFKTLRVGFDSNIAMNIIEKKIGIAKKVLYELKMQLEKTNSNAFSKFTKSSKPLSPLKKIPISKDAFDKISKEHFNKQLNQIHRAQKNINLDSHLQKFPQFRQVQLSKVEQEERRDAQATLLRQSKFREKQLDNIKKSAQFRQDWEQSNVEKWAANMTVRKLQNEKDFAYRSKLENTKIQSKTMSELNAIKALDKDIKDFEKKVSKKPKDDSDSDHSEQDQLPQEPPKLSNKASHLARASGLTNTFDNRSLTKLGATFEAEQLRVKKSPQEVELGRHEREKRRRKMIVEQGKKHQLIKIERREKYILNTLEQNSKQEKEIEYEIWRAWQNKQVIIQNRNSYDQKIKDKEQTRAINAKFKDEELVKTFRDEHQLELKNAIDRQKKLKVEQSVRQRKEAYSECKDIVESFINMTEVLYQFGQQVNMEEINETFVNHLLDEFVESASSKKQVADLELKNYVLGRGEWNIEITKDSEEQTTEPTDDNSLPLAVVNNYYLGNILKTIFTQLYQQQSDQNPVKAPCSNLASLLGLEFAGKTQLSKRIQEQFNFNVILINQLIESKLKDYQDMKDRGIEVDGETAELAEACFKGAAIPNSLIVSLLREETAKHERCLIVNYPTTYQECVEFTRVFGNIQPSDFEKKSQLAVKIEDFSRLVWPTETKYIPRSLKPCGIDFALWVDVSPKTSLDRFLGRRWTPEGECVHIKDEIKNPNTLIVGDKASPIIMKNNFKANNKDNIKNWLKQFGIKVQDNGKNLVQSCWQQLSGQGDAEVVTKNVFSLFQKAISIKEKKNTELQLEELNKKKENELKEEREKFEAELKEKCALTQPEDLKAKFSEALDSMKISETFLKNVQQIWNTTERLTVSTLSNVFQALRQQQESKNRHISQTKKHFIRLLTREDQRFFLVKKFQNQYNQFFEGNSDMINEEYTKEELHQRIEDLETDLLTLIEEKRDDAVSERENIMNSGWLESQLEQIVSSAHVILQTELNRSFACQQIISDFYSKKYMVNTGEIQEGQLELNIDPSLDLLKDGTSPRLEKLISEAMRLFNREQEVVDDKNKKGGKAPPKKDDKKQAKKGGKDEVEENKEPSPEELEYKKSLNTEKSIFRYRVKVIFGYASKRLSDFNAAGRKLYEDLEDLYRYTDKIERQAVLEMTRMFKRAIEEECKIENEVQINYTKVLENHLIRNFQKPKPIILPATEQVLPNRFTISSILEIIKFFSRESEAGTAIKTKRIISLFQELTINERYRVNLPESWKKLTESHFQNFIAKFDRRGKGEIELWIIFTIVMLSDASLATPKQMEQFCLHVTGHNPTIKQVSKENIQNAKAWFDSEEPVEQNVRTFDRNRHLKSIIFDVFKNNKGEVNLEQLSKKLTLHDFLTGEEEPTTTYFEFGFPA